MFTKLSPEDVLQGIASAWLPKLRPFAKDTHERWPDAIVKLVDQFSQLHRLPFWPGFAANAYALYGGRGPSVSAPILVVSAESEEPKGGRPEKMEGWRELSSEPSQCVFVTIAGAGHAQLLERDKATGRCEAADLIVARLTHAAQAAKRQDLTRD